MKKNITIIILASIITFIAVGIEVYIWQRGAVIPLIGEVNLPISIGGIGAPVKNNTLQTNFDEIKTKQQGIAVCEGNRAYSKTVANQEQRQMGMAMADYCYSVVAGSFNDLGLCNKTSNQSECQKVAQEFLEMKKEIEKMSPEEREQMKKLYNGKFPLTQ